MVDSGSSVSIVRQELLGSFKGTTKVYPAPRLQLITASGEPLPIKDHIRAPVKINQQSVVHNFVVVDNPVAPVILGTDFLQQHKLVFDFTTTPVTVTSSRPDQQPTLGTNDAPKPDRFLAVLHSERQAKVKLCAVAAVEDVTVEEAIDELRCPPVWWNTPIRVS